MCLFQNVKTGTIKAKNKHFANLVKCEKIRKSINNTVDPGGFFMYLYIIICYFHYIGISPLSNKSLFVY